MFTYHQLIQRLSRPTPLLMAATATTLLIALPTIRLTILHHRLSKRITSHTAHVGPAARTHLGQLTDKADDHQQPTPPLSAAQFPSPVLTTPSAYNLFHDLSLLALPTASLPRHLSTQDLLTAYLQHTMTLFSSTPQAYALWALSPRDTRRSFDREWIESLPFEEGGLVCGMYRVLGRGEDREGKRGWVCFGMAMNGVEGRLVIGLCRNVNEYGDENGAKGEKGEGRSVFSTETWMWAGKEKGVVIPMEMQIPRFMHRLGSWWLMVSGTEWLKGLAG